MEACQKIDLEFEADGFIDDKQFSGGLITEKEGVDSLLISETDHLPEMGESTEHQQNQKNGRYNLRKSLAWDSAFFTSAGVLDAEELSTMMTGPGKGDKHMLPGIQEELTGSTESLSTLGSDTLTMETLEEDLFVDIRASIQRSSKKPLNLRMSNSKATALEVDSTAISALKKEAITCQNSNQKPVVKKTSSLQTVRMTRCQPKQNIGKSVTGKATKQDSVHSQTSMAKIGGSSTIILPKPPKTISSSIPSSAAGKRDSVGSGHAKIRISNQAIVPGKGTQPPRVTSSAGARRALSKPAPPSSSSLLPSSRRSSTSSNSSSNISSKINPVKSNVIPARRNIGKTSNVATGSSGSIPQTPSRATPKTKLPSTFSKMSSIVSPASSISEWFSASSSSSSMPNQKLSNSRNSIDTRSCRSTDCDIMPLDPTNPSVGQTADGVEYQGGNLTSDNSKKSTAHSGSELHAPGKPSGLRMPSHKFGFFDGVKSSADSPNRHQKSPSAVHNGFPKNGPSNGIPVRSFNSKLKTSKVSTPKMVTSQKPTSPAPSHDKESTDVKNSPSLFVGVNIASKNGVEQVFGNTGGVSIEESLNSLIIEGGDVVLNENNLKKENGHGSKNLGVGLTRVDDKSIYGNFSSTIDGMLSSDALGCAAITSESETCRVILAPKNALVSSECADVAKELVVQVVDKTGFTLSAFDQKENS